MFCLLFKNMVVFRKVPAYLEKWGSWIYLFGLVPELHGITAVEFNITDNPRAKHDDSYLFFRGTRLTSLKVPQESERSLESTSSHNKEY